MKIRFGIGHNGINVRSEIAKKQGEDMAFAAM